MSRGWRVIDLSETDETIHVRKGRLIVGNTTVPLEDCACILTGGSTQWTGHMMAQAAKYDVVVMTCDWKGIPISASLPWSSNTRIAARQHAQIQLSVPKQKNAWMRIVKAKIRGQAHNLEKYSSEFATPIHTRVSDVKSGDPTNVEAQAARAYWSRYIPGEQFSRDRNAGGRNSLLNYGYTILRGFTLRAIIITGLSPTIGIWHHNRANPFGLADDLMEPFRPAIDHVVQILPQGSDLSDPDIKKLLVGAMQQTMNESTNWSVATSVINLAQAFANYVEGNQLVLEVPTWKPVDG